MESAIVSKRLIQYINIDTVGHVSFRVFGNSTHIQKLHLRIGYQCGKVIYRNRLELSLLLLAGKEGGKTRQRPANNVFIEYFILVRVINKIVSLDVTGISVHTEMNHNLLYTLCRILPQGTEA